MKDSDLGGEMSGQDSESVLITRNKAGKPRFPASVLACKHLQTQSEVRFLPGLDLQLFILCLETTQTRGLGEAGALNV